MCTKKDIFVQPTMPLSMLQQPLLLTKFLLPFRTCSLCIAYHTHDLISRSRHKRHTCWSSNENSELKYLAILIDKRKMPRREEPTWHLKTRGPLPDIQVQSQQSFRPGVGGDLGQGPKHYAATRKFLSPSNASRVSSWNAQRPEVLFSDHSDLLLKHEYKRGMIINAPVHEAAYQKGKSRAPSHCEPITAWGSVFTKPRYMIVVALHETQYTAIPLYTHNYEGLRGKEHYQNEFVSVRDGRLSGKFVAQSDYRPLVAEMGIGPIIDAESTAWLTHPISRSYDLNLNVCGRLKQESLDRLSQYMDVEMRKGLGLS